MNTLWSRDWPTTEGWHWLYGWDFGKDDNPAELRPVKVFKISGGFMYVCFGAFIFPSGADGAVGVWAPLELPDVPKESTL